MWFSFAFAFIQLLGLVLADACPAAVPGYTVKDLKMTPSKATFTLVNDSTGKSDALECSLHAGYRCQITGTPSDKSAVVSLQAQMNTLIFSVSSAATCTADGA